MILKDHEGKTYNVHFHHEIGPDEPANLFNHKRRIRGVRETYCYVHPAPCANHTRPCNTGTGFQGMAACSRLDPFCRYTGRKLAFGRAVAHYSKAVRQALWWDFLVQSKVLLPVEVGNGRA